MKEFFTKENIIVASIMAVIVLFLGIFVGVDPIKEWLNEPIVWKETEYIEIIPTRIEEVQSDKLKIELLILNKSDKDLSSYEFVGIINGDKVPFDSSHDSESYNQTYQTFNKDIYLSTNPGRIFRNGAVVSEDAYNKLLNSSLNEIDFEYKTVRLDGTKANGNNFKFRNNGTVKIILILVISAALGYLGIDKAKQSWLRIILKVCGLPAILLIIILFVVVAIFGSSGNSNGSSSKSTNNTMSRDAENRYKRAANLKAGALGHGNTADAARAQAQMDSAMADMIGASSNNSSMQQAQERYKRAANLKAGAVMHGNKSDAARAQAEMDKAMADMIENK